MGKCITGKKMFPSIDLAEEALIETHIRFNYTEGHGPVGVYRCDDCGHFHLTSKGPVNERLAQYRREGKIDREKIANYWTRKLK
jgi:hypothetical protein